MPTYHGRPPEPARGATAFERTHGAGGSAWLMRPSSSDRLTAPRPRPSPPTPVRTRPEVAPSTQSSNPTIRTSVAGLHAGLGRHHRPHLVHHVLHVVGRSRPGRPG